MNIREQCLAEKAARITQSAEVKLRKVQEIVSRRKKASATAWLQSIDKGYASIRLVAGRDGRAPDPSVFGRAIHSERPPELALGNCRI
jgi:hypothetical protein